MGTAATPTAPAFLLDQKWPFRIALAVWLAVGVGAWFLAEGMGRPGQVILVGLWIIGLGLLLRQFILSLFGPVLAYDMLRVGRRSRQIWFRLAYAILLAFLFTWIYFAWVSFRGPGQVRPKDLSQLAETYFGVYMVVQFILVCVLTPASVAGAIAEEKERRTLEFLLATDLNNREIVFGKLATRVGSLLLLLAAGLPILTLMQFFGGIDPDLVIAGFVATVLIVLSLAAVGMAASVLARKARDAIALTYLIGVAYIVLSLLLYGLAVISALKWDFDILGYTISSEDAAYPFVAGNPFFQVVIVLETRGGGTRDLFETLWHFTAFHLFVIVLFLAWAGLRLRSIALAQTFGSTRRSIFRRLVAPRQENSKSATRRRPYARKSTRPEVGSYPIMWKEVFVDAGLRMGAFGKFVIIGLVGLSFVPIALIFWFSFIDYSGWRSNNSDWWVLERWKQFGEGMNAYLRVAGTVATTLVFLAVAVRGSGVISGERDRHTLDVLLTTPLNAPTIVWGKWWGCILGMRWAWAWIFSLWVLTVAAGGVHPIMFPAAIISIAVYASGFAWIGIYCSLQMRSTLRATMAAILLSIFFGGGYFLIFVMCCVLPLSFGPGPGSDMRIFVDLLCSFSPPVNLGWLPVHELNERELSLASRDMPYPSFWILGLIAWGVFSLALSRVCVMKFRLLANRLPMVPERSVRPHNVPPPLPRV
ncbi:MAG: hypothetical protein EXS09_06320 [Gemmataceae bacterium]|nr:hypothetical protein [Gemmataceae bacterium]